LHSSTQSLRYQLQGSSTDVLELIPPYVQTELLDGANDQREKNVKRLRFAAEGGHYDAVFKGFNEAMSGN